ncbi:conserved Plasmodium protein, unknown function [Plasmodium reichenowi]|uniref:Uncharacterized protein n=1 Tax=Plasmodium reichenowi TaxID=5854 RepID=A0A2P9DPT3_PLARE|nr:conserved Plasmodium protein, unknown function [Plasmodium reichenowi]
MIEEENNTIHKDELERLVKNLPNEFNEKLSKCNNNLTSTFSQEFYEEKKRAITDILNKEKKKAYDDIENMKNYVLKNINIINEKNEGIRKQTDILNNERKQNLTCIINLENKIENIKRIIM